MPASLRAGGSTREHSTSFDRLIRSGPHPVRHGATAYERRSRAVAQREANGRRHLRFARRPVAGDWMSRGVNRAPHGSPGRNVAMRYATAFPATVACGAALAACGSAAAPGSKSACVSEPTTLVLSGETRMVEVGAVVSAYFADGGSFLRHRLGEKPPPRVFPWPAARSSDESVLQRVARCPGPGPVSNGPPSRFYPFRALRPGKVTLTAPIVSAWQRVEPASRRPGPYRATVIVQEG